MSGKNLGKKIRFTREAIAKLKPATARYNRFDSETKGLGVVVHESGHKVFFYCRKWNDVPRRVTLGDFTDLAIEQARDQARDVNEKYRKWEQAGFEGPDPTKTTTSSETLETVLDEYCTQHLGKASNAATSVDRCRKFAARVLPAPLLKKKLGQISRSEVAAWHVDMGKTRGQVVANRAIQFLSRLYAFADRSEIYLGRNPTRGIRRFEENDRERYLSEPEVARLFAALDRSEYQDLVHFVKILLFTGARKGDAYAMRWADVEPLEKACWRLTQQKTGEAVVIPLADPVVELLLARRESQVNEWVFPSPRKPGAHASGFDDAWQLLRSEAKLDEIHLHDLRRSLGSWQAELGTSLPIIGKSLGHKGTSSTGIYARLGIGPVREAVNAAVSAMVKASKPMLN
jgi:integrase